MEEKHIMDVQCDYCTTVGQALQGEIIILNKN